MMKTKHPAVRATSRRSARYHQLFEHWKKFVVQLYGNGGTVPTLDWRAGVVIDFVRRERVAFCVTAMTAARHRGFSDAVGSFFFTGAEARKVFNRFLSLKERLGRSAAGAAAQVAHLKPETWSRRPTDWTQPYSAADIDLVIASLVAYWDACALKPADIEPDARWRKGRKTARADDFWDLKPLPKLVRLRSLPKRLLRELEKHAVAMPNPMQPADPPVEEE